MRQVHGITRGLGSLLVATVLLIGISASASEMVSVKTLFSRKALSFQHHNVTVEGTALYILHLPPANHVTCARLYGRAEFVVEDATGMIPVYVAGKCNPNAHHDVPWDGDRVRVTGRVEVTRRTPPYQVRLQATDIQFVAPPN